MPKPPKRYDQHIIPVESIQQRIYLIRGYKVMLDADLADLYGTTTGRMNEQVRRNAGRFPEDFMFQLTEAEHDVLRPQIAISKGRGGRRYLPLAFTEQGVAMLSSILKNQRAIQVNILIVRAFVQLRKLMATHKDVVRKLDELEKRFRYMMKKSPQSSKRSRSSLRQKSHPSARRLDFRQVRPRNHNVYLTDVRDR